MQLTDLSNYRIINNYFDNQLTIFAYSLGLVKCDSSSLKIVIIWCFSSNDVLWILDCCLAKTSHLRHFGF